MARTKVFSFTKLQEEQKPWVARNFPNRDPGDPLFGMFEEYAELLIADSIDEVKDAVADITIFLTDFCNTNNLNLDQIVFLGRKEDLSWMDQSQLQNAIGYTIGQISHHFLKRKQNIRGTFREHTEAIETRISELIGILRHFSNSFKFSYEQAVTDTWNNIVSKREWRKTNVV